MKVFEKVAGIVKKHPWAVVIVCLILTVALGFGLLLLKGHVTYESLLPEEFPSVKAIKALDEKFGGISYEYVLLRAPDVTSNEIVEKMIGLEGALNKDPRFNTGQLEMWKDAAGEEIPVVQDYLTPLAATMKQEMAKMGLAVPLDTIKNSMVRQFTGKDFHDLIEQDYLGDPRAAEQVVGRFITPDRKTALIMIKDGAGLTEQQQIKLGGDVKDFFEKRFAGVPGVKISIAGDATLARDFNAHIMNKTILLCLIAFILAIVTLFLAFRRISDTVLPVVVMALGLVWTFGFLGLIGVDYSVAVIAVMPLLLGTALTFVVPFIARYYEESERFPRVESVGMAMVGVGVAVFLAAITNVFGFLVFGFSVLPALRDFGMTCAIGTVFVFALSVTLLPAVIILRDKAGSGKAEKATRRKDYFDGLSLRKSRSVFSRATSGVLNSFTRLSVQHSALMIIVFALLIIGGFLQLRGLTTDSDLRKLVPASLPGINADFEIESYFGGQQQDVIMVEGDVLSPEALRAMADVEAGITGDEAGTTGRDLYDRIGVTGLPDALAAANNGVLPTTREEVMQAVKMAEDNGGYITGGLLSADHKYALITLNAEGAQSTSVVNRKIALMRRMSDKYLEPAGLTYQLGGITPLTKDMTKNIIPTETLASTLSLALCALVLVIIFRSFAFGLITLTVALAGVAAEIGFLRVMGWPLDIMTSLVSALVIGIGVNFGILFMYRYIEEIHLGKSSRDAIESTMDNLGRANIIAALTTIAAFVIVMFSGIVPLKRFGGVTAVAIGMCLLASLTLMPALLYRLSSREARRAVASTDKDSEPQSA